jgi:hypothetical protein
MAPRRFALPRAIDCLQHARIRPQSAAIRIRDERKFIHDSNHARISRAASG